MTVHDDLGPSPARPAGGGDWGPRRRPPRLGLFHLGLLAALIFAAAFAAAPWFALRAVRAAAAAQDIQALGELVDYNAVRSGLRAQIHPTPAAQMPAPKLWEDPLGAMRHALQQPVLQPQPQVDDYLTPDALARMTQGLPPRGEGAAPGRALPKLIYWDPRRCRFGVSNPSAPTQVTVLTFARTGLFDWRLVRVRLPAEPRG